MIYNEWYHLECVHTTWSLHYTNQSTHA